MQFYLELLWHSSFMCHVSHSIHLQLPSWTPWMLGTQCSPPLKNALSVHSPRLVTNSLVQSNMRQTPLIQMKDKLLVYHSPPWTQQLHAPHLDHQLLLPFLSPVPSSPLVRELGSRHSSDNFEQQCRCDVLVQYSINILWPCSWKTNGCNLVLPDLEFSSGFSPNTTTLCSSFFPGLDQPVATIKIHSTSTKLNVT